MSMHATRILIGADGSVKFPGIDYESAKLTVHRRQGDMLVVHIPGRSYWSGIGAPRKFARSMFEVVRLKGRPRKTRYLGIDVEEYSFEHVIEFDIKKEKPTPPSGRRS